MGITHAAVVVIPDDPAFPVGSDEWNEPHVGETFQVASVTLSSAQILDLKNTYVELLPALSGRQYYAITYTVLHYRFGTVPYVGKMFNIRTFYGSTPAEVGPGKVLLLEAGNGPGFVANDLLEQTQDAYVFAPRPMFFDTVTTVTDYVAWFGADIEGKPYTIANVDTDITDGDGQLTIRTGYMIIDGAP